MAKRRKTRTSSRRRRRRIGAVTMSATSPVVQYGSIAAGYLLEGQIKPLIDKITGGQVDTKIVNGVLAAGGLYFMFMHKGKKSVITTILSGLAAGAGTKGLLTDFGVITGFKNIPVVGSFQNVPVIGNGYNVPTPSLSGVEGYNVPSVMAGIGKMADDEGGLLDSRDK